MPKLSHEEIELVLNTGNWMREQGRYSDAFGLAEIARRASPESNYVHGSLRAELADIHSFKLIYQQEKTAQNLKSLLVVLQKARDFYENNNNKLSDDDKAIYFESCAIAQELVGNWTKAAEFYKISLDLCKHPSAYKGRILGHLAKAQYKSGDKQVALHNLQDALSLLETHDERALSADHSYRWEVWYSGILMNYWEVLSLENDAVAAVEVEKKIQEIISSEKLIHRRRQWQELKQNILLAKK